MIRKLAAGFIMSVLSFSVFAQSKMVKIPSGSFNMGSPASERQRNVDEKQHSVSLSSFYADAYEVTQKSFQAVMGKNPSVFKGDNLPVENVSWFDAIEYCNRLSEREGLEKCYTVHGKDVVWNRAANGYRLLTEAEWDIMEPLCVEILFSLCYGRMQNIDPEEIPLIFKSAKKKLGYMTEKETLDQAFIRYFKENSVTLTMPLVGTNFHRWDYEPCVLDKLTDNLNCEDLIGAAEKIRNAKHKFYEALEASVQAEPYNPHDKNAILVCIENIEAKIFGNPGLEKAGYIRALAAKVIREAKLEKMSYDGKLCRVSQNEIVVKMTV